MFEEHVNVFLSVLVRFWGVEGVVFLNFDSFKALHSSATRVTESIGGPWCSPSPIRLLSHSPHRDESAEGVLTGFSGNVSKGSRRKLKFQVTR